MSPFIGISSNMLTVEEGRFAGRQRVYIDKNYIEAVSLAGGLPFVIPICDEEEQIEELVEKMEGLILSGGQDVNPLLYGEEPSLKLGNILPKRDWMEQYLIQYAIEKEVPILAICRGVQILNVTCGGTLYQDISMIKGASIKHDQYSNPSTPTHTVDIQQGTRLFELYGEPIRTNSFHHQAVKQIAPGFKLAGISKDGVIEAIEKEGDSFVVGVQWHPEMMAKESEQALELFKCFIRYINEQR